MKRTIALLALLGMVGSAGAATVAHWSFEEGATGTGDTGGHAGDWDNHYQDISGNGNHMSTWDLGGTTDHHPAYTATVPYNPVPQTGAANNLALDFAGGPKDIGTFGAWTGAKSVETNMFTHWTVEATFKLNSLGFQVLVGKDGKRGDLGGSGGAGPEAPFWLKLLDFNKHLEVLAVDDNDVFHTAATLAPIQSNQWYSVAARFDGTAIDLWLKGPGDTEYVFQNASDFFGPDVGGVGCSLGGFTNMNGGAWSIGRGAWDTNAVDFVDGIIDEVRISDVVLAPNEFINTDGFTIAHWRFEEGATGTGDTGGHPGDFDDHYLDISGNGNHMSTWDLGGTTDHHPAYTATVPFSPVAGIGPNMLALDFAGGSKDIGTFGAQTIKSYMFTNWTVEATFRLNTLGTQVLVGKDGQRGDLGGTVGDEAPFWLKMRGWEPGTLEVLTLDDNENIRYVASSSGAISTGEWYSVAARYDGVGMDLWLKGPGDTNYVFQNSVLFTDGASLGGFTNMNGGAWSIGRGASAGSPVDYVDGIIDEVRISKYVVSHIDFLRAGVSPLPPIGDIVVEQVAGGLDLTWTTGVGHNYVLLEKSSLQTPTWSTNQAGIPGGVSNVTVMVLTTNDAAFYKATSEQ